MPSDVTLILIILTATMAMFLWGRWRHDMVAAGALLACVLAGLIAPGMAFSGFGHPAVITVACVLVLSRGLQTSGAVDVLARHTLPAKAGPLLSLTMLVGLGAVLSGFMNNVGAMALLMPIAIQLADRLKLPPGRVLMPLAFGTILGGMTTMIGTPPNLIVSGFRAEMGTDGFAMFDFTPVGIAVAAGGIIFIILAGRHLVPSRQQQGHGDFETSAYMTEAAAPEDSKAVGMTLREIESVLDEADAQIVGLVRNEVRISAPKVGRRVLAGDILVIEAEADSLSKVLSSLGLKLVEAEVEEDAKGEESGEPEDEAPDDPEEEVGDKKAKKNDNLSSEIVLMELVVRPGSGCVGRSASDLLLRTRYGLNLLAISREGTRSKSRLRSMPLQPGDLLLMQGAPEAVIEFAGDFNCVPLAARTLNIPDKRKAVFASLIMAGAVAGAAFGLLPAAISFAIGVLASMALRTVPPRAVYDAIDWPVIVLLGALIPVAGAMDSTGTADLIARFLTDHLAQGRPIACLAAILIITMFLSDLMNNAATAAVMCPIAIGTAEVLKVNPDSFLMAVGIGASCAFLTPIGHQNNTLILGPGGFKFRDYWRLGLPLEIIVILISIPLLLVFWPL